MIKKLAIGLIAIFAIASCAGTEEPTPAPTVTKTVEAPAPIVRSDEDEMVDAIRLVASDFYGVTDGEIIMVAKSLCEALRSGGTIEDVVYIAESNIGYDNAVALTAGAITYICPDQEYKLP